MNGERVMSQSALGRALDLSPAAITKLKGQGMPVHSLEAAQAWRMERQSVARRKSLPNATRPAPPASPAPPLTPPAMGDADPAFVPEFNVSRARREAAEAHLAELKLAEERGDLVRASAARAAAQKRYAGLRESLLQIPSRVVPLLAASTDAASMDKILRAEIVSALEQLTSRVE